MAGKVFFSVTMSLDGFIAPGAVPVGYVFSPEGQGDPRSRRWLEQWSQLQAWLLAQRWFRDPARLALSQARAEASSRVTHLTYTVGGR